MSKRVRRCQGVFPLVVELESRRLFTAAFPSDNEQYIVELINRARANPGAEATRLGLVLDPTLNTPKQPLALNPYLVSSARGQSQYLADSFYYSTTGQGGSTPQQRMAAAGYTNISGIDASRVSGGQSSGPHPRTKFGRSGGGGTLESRDAALQALITRIQIERKTATLP